MAITTELRRRKEPIDYNDFLAVPLCFIFKLSAPDMKDVLDVYKAGDSFNADEQRMIISAVTGQVFFIGSTELRTNVKITTGEYIKSLFEDKTGENYNKEGN